MSFSLLDGLFFPLVSLPFWSCDEWPVVRVTGEFSGLVGVCTGDLASCMVSVVLGAGVIS